MTIMNTVFNNKSGIPPSSAQASTSTSDSSTSQIDNLNNLPPVELAAAKYNAKMGTFWAFVSILPFMWLCVLAASGLGNVRITRRRKVDEKGQTDFSENVTESSFLGALVRRGFGKGKRKNSEDTNGVKEGKRPEKNAVVDGTVV